MQAKEILLKAADEMERRGKCSGRYSDSHGRVCLYGAVNLVMSGDPFHANYVSGGYVDVMNAIEKVVKGVNLIDFSDKNNKRTVVAAFRRAADSL